MTMALTLRSAVFRSTSSNTLLLFPNSKTESAGAVAPAFLVALPRFRIPVPAKPAPPSDFAGKLPKITPALFVKNAESCFFHNLSCFFRSTLL